LEGSGRSSIQKFAVLYAVQIFIIFFAGVQHWSGT